MTSFLDWVRVSSLFYYDTSRCQVRSFNSLKSHILVLLKSDIKIKQQLSSVVILCLQLKSIIWLVGWLVVLRIYVALAVFQPYRDLEAGDNQSLKFKWRDRESNPGPLAPQAKSLTTRSPPLPHNLVLNLGNYKRSMSLHTMYRKMKTASVN